MKIVRTNPFLKALKRAGADEGDLRALESELQRNPDSGDVIPGTDGIRKIRFAIGNRGKRGGGRAIYVAIKIRDTIYLLTAYAKNQKEDLTAEDKKVWNAVVKELKDG
ncbi:MAG: type II toxin-antitoxin system RelE/ParE family toxin [Alphaproteobacteria bacterium]|jgi:hypothetical protein|nr:type II toxin-antitoxin system RelE/ParE family toxin [Alphaproteobacteria bacterium]MBN9570318.1 type II toxin-antitoxin system RelE/ParE family toxin [Alphaproteobacteria bacterium]MBN9578961.1 type II toxin-antitoxin system RelE/ParE family toxin [Alphaproteobacteria bacterium]